MNPINILIAVNLFVSLSANWSAAKKGLKSTFTSVKERPASYLQKFPPNVSALTLVLIILGIFNIGTMPEETTSSFINIKYGGLIIFILFSWLQVYAFKSLGKSYAPDILIFKEHKLCTGGMYKIIRHPQYVSQILSDLGAGLAMMSYLVIPVVLLVEIPLFILRAKFEEKLLLKHFPAEYKEYRKKTGAFLPFIG